MAKPLILGHAPLSDGVNTVTAPAGTTASILVIHHTNPAASNPFTISGDIAFSSNGSPGYLPYQETPTKSGLYDVWAPCSPGSKSITIDDGLASTWYDTCGALIVFLGEANYADMVIDRTRTNPEDYGDGSAVLTTEYDCLVLLFDFCNRAEEYPASPANWSDVMAPAAIDSVHALIRQYTPTITGTTLTVAPSEQRNPSQVSYSLRAGTPAATAPVLTSATASATGPNSASGSVSTDKSGGTLYYLASQNSSETASTIKTTGASQAVSATGAQAVTRSGLSESTPYHLHFVHAHPDGDSNVLSSAQFYTQDAAGARDTPELVGMFGPTSLTSAALPPALTLTVPASAKFVLIYADITDYPGPNTMHPTEPITTNFTGTGLYMERAQTSFSMGRAALFAPVTATGTGRTITVKYGSTNDFAPPSVTAYFLDKVDSTYPLRRPVAFAGSADGTTAATATCPTASTDLVLVQDMRGDNDAVYPALGTGFTDVGPGTYRGTAGGLGYSISTRTKRVTTPVDGTASATTQNTLASTISIAAIRGQLQVADTTAPTLSAATASASAANVANGSVTSNEAGTAWAVYTTSATTPTAVQIKAGQTHTGAAAPGVSSNRTMASGVNTGLFPVTTLTGSTTYYLHVTATDAAGNTSTPVSSAGFTTPAPSDTTAPVLTSATGTATGTTTATVGVTTDEANGTLRCVVTTSATQPSVAQIKAGQTHTGAAAPYAGSQVVSSTGAKTFSATALASGTQHYAHFCHTDTANNDSNRITSAGFTTTAADTTPPTLSSAVGTVESNALIVVGATTNEANGTMYLVVTTSATPPSALQVRNGQDHTGTAATVALSQSISSTGAKTFNATGLSALTAYYPYIVHRDAAGNDSAVFSVGLRTTFRDGATGQWILDNTGPNDAGRAGILYNDVRTGDEDKWFSFRILSQSLGGGTLTINPDGTFHFEGSNPASLTYQLEVDGVDTGSDGNPGSYATAVTLYSATFVATPANSASPSSSESSSAIQTHRAFAANSSAQSSSTQASATQTNNTTAASSASASTSTAAFVSIATPTLAANSVAESTSSASITRQTHPATSASSASHSTSSASNSYPSGVTVAANSVSASSSTSANATQVQASVGADTAGGSTTTAVEVRQVNQAVPLPSDGQSSSGASRAFHFNLTRDADYVEYPVDENSGQY
jgi:hypothetical protein